MSAKMLLLAALGLFQTLGVGQNALAHTDALRGDLEQLIVGDELESRSMDIWRGGIRRSASSEPDARMLVSCFFLQTFTAMSSPRGFSPTIMPSYTIVPGPDEQRAAILCVEQAVADSLAGLKRDQRTGGALLDIALVRLIAIEYGDITPSPLVSVRNSVR